MLFFKGSDTMKDLRDSSLLSPVKDQFTGVTYYKLANPYNRIQNNYYFTVSSTTSDDRYLSIVSSDPVDREQNIWIADFEKDVIRPVTTKGFSIESMILDEKRGKIWYAQDNTVYSQNIDDEVPDRSEKLFSFPEEIAKGRPVTSFSNHITFNHDGTRFAFAGSVDDISYIGYYDITDKKCHIVHESTIKATHVQFSPDSSNRIMFCHDHWISQKTKMHYDWDHRIWIYDDRTGKVYATYLIEHDKREYAMHRPFHEFWQPEGKCIYLCDMPNGVVRHDPDDPESYEIVWPGMHCHAHADLAGNRFVSDINPYGWPRGEPAHVSYFDRISKKEGFIVYNLPPAPKYPNQQAFNRHYHSHPHPSFSSSENYVNFTSTMGGALNVCLVFTADIFK
jgi:hypothetical protein